MNNFISQITRNNDSNNSTAQYFTERVNNIYAYPASYKQALMHRNAY